MITKEKKALLKSNYVLLPLGILIFLGFFYGLSMLFGIGSNKVDFDYTDDEVAEIEKARATTFDPNNPDTIVEKVDYAKGKQAKWYPKGESPMLKEMVQKKELPPLLERIGTDPCVFKGVDGVGNYGGTLALGTTDLKQDPGYRWRTVSFVRWSPQGSPVVPFMAKSWEVSDDNRVYTFHLREGLRWSDGYPFTTEDIMYAIEVDYGVLRYYYRKSLGEKDAAPSLPCGLSLDTKIEALDKHTIRFTFKEPNGTFLQQLATFNGNPFFNSPKHYLSQFYPYHEKECGGYGNPELIDRLTKEKNLPNRKSLYGQVKSFSNPDMPSMTPWICRKQSLTPPYEYVRNPYYPAVDEAGNQLPYTDRLFMDVKNVRMLDVAVAQGNYSFHVFFDGFVDYNYIMSQRKNSKYEVYHWYSGDSSKFTIAFNMNIRGSEGETEWKNKRELFSDVRFRRAMSVAVNRQAIIDALYAGVGEAGQNMPRKESLFYDAEALAKWAQYDPDLANKLLDEAGYTKRDEEGFRTYKDGSQMMIIFTIQDPLWEGMARFVGNYWSKVGVRNLLVVRAGPLFRSAVTQQTYDTYVWNGNNEYYPVLDPRFFSPGTSCGYAPAYSAYYQLIDKGNTPEAIKAMKRQTVQAPPEGHPLIEARAAWKAAIREREPKKQAAAFKKAVEIAADNVWAISIVGAPPTLAVVADGLKNVPKTVVSAWDFLTPFNAYPELFYFEEPRVLPAVVAGLQKQLVTPEYSSSSNRMSVKETKKDGGLLGTLLSWAFLLILILFILHMCISRPYFAHRLLLMIPTLFIISVLVFIMIQLPDGDFITNRIVELELRGETVNPQDIQQLKDMFNLDDPMVVRYTKWMGIKWFATFNEQDKGLLQGFMGYSMATLKPVNNLIGDRLALTMCISAMTVLFMWIVSMPLGLYCACKQYSWGDYALTFIGFLGMCIPNFVLALFVIYMADVHFGLKVSGLFSPEYAADPTWSMGKFVDLLKHIWVPVFVSAAAGTGGGIRGTRANVLDELRKPYVRTALAKGVHPMKVLLKYPFRMTLNPFISGIGGIFPMLVSGGALIAIVLSLPTVGPLLLDATLSQDMYMAGSLMMLFTVLGVIGTLVSDLLLLVLDPRIRYSGGSR